MTDAARLLGFAFAGADLLFEVDSEGTIVFAAGATHDYVRDADTDLVGSPAARLFLPSDGSKFVTRIRALAKGERAGPLKLKLASGAVTSVAMFRLPANGDNISCTLAGLDAAIAAPNHGSAMASSRTG